jgi:hypothetical protein
MEVGTLALHNHVPSDARDGLSGLVDPIALQALYYPATGLWPILHLRSFMAVTGRKKEPWLVQTFGALLGAVGMSMLAARDRRGSSARLGIACPLTLAAPEAVFVAKGRIRAIYLVDGVVELAMAAGATGELRPDPATGKRRAARLRAARAHPDSQAARAHPDSQSARREWPVDGGDATEADPTPAR